jgi:tetratricopeptide (TPR) repeat protein
VNGFLPETAELRGDILKKLVACGTPAAAKPNDAASRADALIDAWIAAYNRGDYDGSLASLRSYIALYPKDATGYVFAARTYVAKGDIDGAERVLLQGQGAAHDAPSILVELGSLYQKHRKDEPRATVMLRKAVALPSASLQDLVVAGELLWLTGEDKDAMEVFRRAVQMRGDPIILARGWVGFGRSQVKARRYPQALAALNEAVRLNPKSADAHRALKWLHDDQGNVAAALAEQELVARFAPDDGWEQRSLGEAYAAQKRIADASGAYDRALGLAPKDRLARDLLTSLAEDYEKIGRLDRAAEALRAAIAKPHDGTQEGIEDKALRDSFDCAELGRLLVAQKKYPDVVRLYLARGDCNGLGGGWLGIAYQNLGQSGRAMPLLEDELRSVEKAIAQYESELAGGKLAKDERTIRTRLLAESKAEAALQLDALGRAYLAGGRRTDALRTARTLQKYDARLGARLAADIESAP